MNKNIYYNTSSFKFFRRHVKQNEMEKEFINLINVKDKKIHSYRNFNIKKNLTRSLKLEKPIVRSLPKERSFNLDLYFQKKSIDLINKIRDLFIEFDENKSNTFDQYEFYQMFKLNKIPIKMEEIIYLFKFNAHKKVISFSELINLTIDPEFDQRYKEVIDKIKPRCEIGIICPINFSGMLSHLCEFGKLSPDAKKFHKKLSKLKSKSVFSNSLLENNNRYYLKHKNSIPIRERKVKINFETKRSVPINFQERNLFQKGNKSIFNRNNDFMAPVELMPDSEFYKRTLELKRENEVMTKALKTMIEISHKKLHRYENTFKDTNYRNKIETSKINLANSFNTLKKLNPKMKNKTYISFCPLKEEFINLNTGGICDFKTINEYKSKENKNRIPYKPTLTEINKNHDKYIKYNPFLMKNYRTLISKK